MNRRKGRVPTFGTGAARVEKDDEEGDDAECGEKEVENVEGCERVLLREGSLVGFKGR